MVGVLVGIAGKVGVATVRQLSMNVTTTANMINGANHSKRFIRKPPGFKSGLSPGDKCSWVSEIISPVEWFRLVCDEDFLTGKGGFGNF